MMGLLRTLGLDNRLGLRLVIASLIVGSVLSVFSTGLQLATSYARQRSDASLVLGRVEETLVSSLEQAVWTFNFNQVDIILDGLSSDPSVSFVRLTTNTGQMWTRGDVEAAQSTSDAGRVYDLVHGFDSGRTETVGVLDVRLSLAAVRARVWAQFWTTFLTNLAKAYLAALALLFLVQRMISRHLRRIVDHVNRSQPDVPLALALDRPKQPQPDDIDRIVTAVEGFETRTHAQMHALNHEIDVRKVAETEAREALSIRSRFLATMSHEIRTPLNAIMGFLHLIENYDGVADKPRLYAETATKASHQLMSLMNNSLDMSRLEANAIEIELVPTDIRALANDWHQSAQGMRHMRNKDIDVTLEIAPDVPDVLMIDAPHVTQVVSNLVDNAIKFTETGTVAIRIDTEASAHDAVTLAIRVLDTGVGVPDEARVRIFDRFSQADNGMLRSHGGSGLGLAICLELARLLEASLQLDEGARDGFTTIFLLELKNVAVVDPPT